MFRYQAIFIAVIIALSGITAGAQDIERFNTFQYNVNEGLLQSNIGDLNFDKHNFCWISFANGIQKFNGKIFSNVPIQDGLPDDKWANFFSSSRGDLFIGHSKGISYYDINSDKFKQIYFNKGNNLARPIFIGEDNNKIYFFSGQGTITGLDNHQFNIVSETKTVYPIFPNLTAQGIKFSSNIIDHKVALMVDHQLYVWDLEKKEQVARSERNPYLVSYFLHMLSPFEVMYYHYETEGRIEYYNFLTGKSNKDIFLNRIPFSSSRIHCYSWFGKKLVSVGNRLFESDNNITQFSKELVNLQHLPIAGKNTVVKMKQDHFGNLYLVTINSGFYKLIRNNYPIRYFGTQVSDSNYTISILPDKENNRIFAGTRGNGLLVFDTLQHLRKHIKYLPGNNYPFSLACIVKRPRDGYLLFITGEKCIWQLSHDLKTLKKINYTTTLPKEKSVIHYFSKLLYQDDRLVFVLSQGSLYKLDFAKKQFTEILFAETYTMSGMFFNDFILTHTGDSLLFIDSSHCKVYKKIPFKNTSHVRCFTKDNENRIYIGSNNGIFIIDSSGKILKHLTTADGLPDNCIYAMETDSNGALWCSTNKGIFSLNKRNDILQLRKDDGLQENEFNTNIVAKTADGELYFGGINGVSSFYPYDINRYEENIHLLVTGIKINNETAFNDTASWNISDIKLPYNQNNLSFDFIAMANNNPGQYVHQYMMEGIDKDWIQNTELQTIRYILPPGKYNLKLYASRFFDVNAKPLKEIVIHIKPPFWRTWLFSICLSVILISALVYFINQYNKRKYNKKLLELQSEHKLQLERERISRDLHDSIGAYANAVLYKTDLLQQEPMQEQRAELMKDLRFASKDIITSLRETIWALQKEEYTDEECLLRIRNFIQPFNRYYPTIHFSVIGNADATKKLNNNKALNLVRIVQEAVTNAIKHANATNITVTSEIANGQWKLLITDDGNGFSVSEHELSGGNGLANMKQRATDAGFDISFDSNGHSGSEISIIIR